jgi:serine/threonine-protein kinase HipA
MKRTEKNKRIFVYADWKGLQGPVLMGTLLSEILRGKEVFSFNYDSGWLNAGKALYLDPDLQMYPGSYYLSDQRKSNFKIFLDSSPDRWGRVLMQRREAALARLNNKVPEKLFETDYLMGVFDGHRMGGLRFKSELSGPFLDDNKILASPPWTSIGELEQISLRLEQDETIDDPEYIKWLNMLIAPGTSLGGARPKAGVTDDKNQLWIAKFPSRNDISDTGAWEMVAHQLALEAGISMATCMVKIFSADHHTFLTKRFDRTQQGERIHFASAMTLLGYNDGQDHSDGISYLELAHFIQTHGYKVKKDLEELWRRIVFNICVSNVDDHLRNHGFLLSEEGWQLSPAYDLNPVETGTGLKLNISEDDNALDLELAMDVHEYFRLSYDEAKRITGQIQSVVQTWRQKANELKISKTDQELKQMAFSQAERKLF